ncbi:MAG TPA: hypothetical protein VHU92_16575 [Streptosporangiaceae bacterium]|nr:hypothetical protein [Streptosporangiaceae bacterium]
MSTLEEQVRAATRARASEITPDRIRPLDLARTRPFAPIFNKSRWRWSAPLAAAAAVAAIAAVVASVGGSPGRPAQAGRPAEPAGRVVAGPKHLVSRAPGGLDEEVLGLFVPATGPQFADGLQLQGTILALKAADTARCLARHGVTVSVPSVARMTARYAGNYVDNGVFPDLARISRTHVFVPGFFIEQLRAPAGQHQAFRHWLGPCQTSAAAVSAPLMSAGRRLGDGIWATVTSQAPAARPVRATLGALRACAARYGRPHSPYAPPAPIRSFSDFADWVFGHLDGAGSRGAGAAAMRRLRQHWSVVFVRCGRPVLAAQDRWLAARQATFVRQHERQVRALDALARSTLLSARAGAVG